MLISNIPFVRNRLNDLQIIKNHYLQDFPITYYILTVAKPLFFILLFNGRLFYNFFGLTEKISYLDYLSFVLVTFLLVLIVDTSIRH